ncbi:MAG: hypothetical protein ACLSGI_02225 [Butyricicoccaceae bacterium]
MKQRFCGLLTLLLLSGQLRHPDRRLMMSEVEITQMYMIRSFKGRTLSCTACVQRARVR